MTETKYILDLKDFERMLQIERASFPSPWSEDDILAALRSKGMYRVLGAYEDDKLCGWACFAPALGQAHLLTLAIDPIMRRKGLGRALLNACIQAASDAGCQMMALECRSKNFAAQGLYESAGFRRLGVRKGYYTDTGDDAIIYVLPKLPEGDCENDPFLIRE